MPEIEGLDAVQPQRGGVLTPNEPLPRINTAGEYAILPAGSEFTDPDGNKRRKPYAVKDRHTFDAVPEGEQFLDPQGELRTKPKYEGISFTSQTLYDMALTDAERKKALEFSYPGKVKGGDGQELFVEDEDGVLRKPGRGSLTSRAGAATLGMAAPVGGAVLGTIGGAAAAAPTGPGAIAGGAAGGAGGGLLGQSFNDLVLRLAGVYDRTTSEEAANLALAGLSSAAGSGVGKGIATLAPAAKGLIQGGSAALPKMVAGVLGADAERLATAKRLADEGLKVPPSSVFMEAPYLHTAVEVFDPKFRTQNVLKQGAEQYYEDKAGKVLDDMGVKRATSGKISEPEAAVSSERAGAALLTKTGEEMAAQDAKLEAAVARLRQEVASGREASSSSYNASLEEVRKAADASKDAAQNAINAGFKSIQDDVTAAMKVAEVGGNSGELWGEVARKLQATRQGIMARANRMYSAATEAAGGHLPNTQGLPDLAKDFAASLPENFRVKHPDIVKKLEDWAGKFDKETGEMVAEPIRPTFGELHNVRSYMRSNVDYYDLTPGQREGAYKYFAKRVDQALHDKDAVPQLKTASELLDKADTFYRENMSAFKDRNIQSVVSALESGLMPDPKLLANTVLKEGRSELINKVKTMIGPNLWNAVKAADMQEMLDLSKTLVPGQLDGRAFASQVLDRVRTGNLAAVYDEATANKLMTQAQHIMMNEGKLPITVRPGDTVATVIERARMDADAVKAAAQKDPIGMLGKEMKDIDRLAARERSQMVRRRRDEPLGFLYDKTVGASEAADRILSDKDLIFAAAAKFGEGSPEFNMLRQVYAERMLTGTLDPGARLAKGAKGLAEPTPEIQRIMFPGASLDEMKTLAKNMDFLLGSRALGADATGSSIAAQSRVLNPWGSITGLGKFAKPLKIIPGTETLGRFILTKYYQILSDVVTSPTAMQWIARGLEGGPIEREAVREAIRRSQATGRPIGAAIGEVMFQMQGGENVGNRPRR